MAELIEHDPKHIPRIPWRHGNPRSLAEVSDCIDLDYDVLMDLEEIPVGSSIVIDHRRVRGTMLVASPVQTFRRLCNSPTLVSRIRETAKASAGQPINVDTIVRVRVDPGICEVCPFWRNEIEAEPGARTQ